MAIKNIPVLSPEESAKEIERLQGLLAQKDTQIAEISEGELKIRAKQAAGLSREQAVAAVEHQAAFDKHNETVLKERKEARAKREAANKPRA